MGVDLALEWAKDGHRVLPVSWSGRKRPLIKQWQLDCTDDEATLRRWWANWPQARVGLATGSPGFDVLDFDVADGKPGLAQMTKLIDAGVLVPGTFRVVATPSGGRHVYLRGTDQRNKQNEKTIPGVDFRGVGGMVLAPGNDGYRYIIGQSVAYGDLAEVDWSAIAAALAPPEPTSSTGLLRHQPDRPSPSPTSVVPMVMARLSGRLEAPPKPEFDNAPGEESPLDWYVARHMFEDILPGDGWQFAHIDAEGRVYWTRPGKKVVDGVSANVALNRDGRQTLMNYSSSVGWLPTDRGMSIAQYVAYRDFGGDLKAAARHIRQAMMPRREQAPTTPLLASPATQTALPGTSIPPGATEGTKSQELVPAAEAGPPEGVRAFWKSRPELREVWYKAQIGGVSPWAVLGNILANVAGRVGPHVALPPLGGVGAAASLNILVAISGNSGAGKGRSGQVAREFMGAPYPPQRKPGTGQGIAAMFTVQTKEGPVQENDTVVLNVAEITQLGAHMNQQGATITSTLLEVYMGEELGEHYANKELRRPVREGAYRLALVAGVQPDNSTILFDHMASGLPQRFVWMPGVWIDSILPDGPTEPPPPGPERQRWRAWSAILPGSMDDTEEAHWSPTDVVDKKPGKAAKELEAVAVPVKEPALVTYAPMVRREIERSHSRRLNEIKRRMLAGADDPGDPDSHLLLTRAKVASLLAIWLDSQAYVTDEMWALAGWVIWVSNDTRTKAQARLSRKAQDKAAIRAAGQIATSKAVKEDDERTHNATYIRACDRLTHLAGVIADWTSVKELRGKMSSLEKRKIREAGIEVADVLGDLVIAGKMETRETNKSGNAVTEYRAK